MGEAQVDYCTDSWIEAKTPRQLALKSVLQDGDRVIGPTSESSIADGPKSTNTVSRHWVSIGTLDQAPSQVFYSPHPLVEYFQNAISAASSEMEGLPPTPEAMTSMELHLVKVIETGVRFPRIDVLDDGAILAEWRTQDRFLVIAAYPTGTLRQYHSSCSSAIGRGETTTNPPANVTRDALRWVTGRR